jgi:hypothetical protein
MKSFKKFAKIFFEKWNLLNPGLNCLVIGDNLQCHRQISILKDGIEQGIYMWFFPSNTTHWSQPLDNLLFANLKRCLNESKAELDYQKLFVKDNLFSLVSETLKAATKGFTKKITAAAFRNTGVFPFSQVQIQKLARQHHIPLEEEKSTDLSKENQIIDRVVTIIEDSWKKQSLEAQNKVSQIEKVTIKVKKNVMFDPREILEVA